MKIKIFFTLLIILSFNKMFSQDKATLKSWHDNKYSMFIHFGVYSELAGVWKGQPNDNGYSEQIQARAGIFADVYEEIPARFNPTKWNAEAIVSLAKKAGMRSIVITSKHHDGFCMFKTATTRFNMVDATPFKRDVLKELADACKSGGINLGFYFSLIDYTLHPSTSHNANPITVDHHEYNKKQVTELLTNYGPISELWFDMGSLTDQQSSEMYQLVHRLQPNCMVSGRLGNNAYDFCVMGDNEYPDYKIDAPWQTPASIFNETWGYRSWQKRENVSGKIQEKLLSLIKVVSRGGNYLLNIGPKGDGSVVPYEAEVLIGIGNWLSNNGEAIYGTMGNPFPETFSWGEMTAKENNLYLILSGEATPAIVLNGLSGKIKQISLLTEPQTIFKYKVEKDRITIPLSETIFQSNNIQVLKLQFNGNFHMQPENVVMGKATVLNFQNAIKHYSYSCIDYYNNHRSIVKQSWNFTKNQKAVMPLVCFTAEEVGKKIELNWNGEKEIVKLEDKAQMPMNQKSNPIKWENRFSYGPFQCDFEGVPGPLSANINTLKPWSKSSEQKWNLISGWQDGEKTSIVSKPFQSWFVLQEISTENSQNQLVEICSGDGVQVWLNGENLVKHNNLRGSKMNKEIVLLPLQAGKNQLLIKVYNRYEWQMDYSIQKEIDQTFYYQKLSPRNFSGFTNCDLKLCSPESVHQPIRMNNISLQF